MKRTEYIYVLINPKNKEIFYVGCTINPKARLSFHKCTTANTYSRTPKDWYIVKHKIVPEMEIIETVNDGSGIGTEREWIKKLRKEGHPLTNTPMWDESHAA